MSQENVEVILRLVDALSLREPTEEDIAPLLTPDYTVQNVRTAVTDKTYRGTVGVLRWRNDLIDVFAEDVRIEGDVVADGVDFVVARARIVGKGTGSGAPLTLRFASVNWFEGGRIRRTVGYARVSEALKAVGLEGAVSEELTTPDLEEMVRRAVEAGNRHDFDALVALYSPDAVFDRSGVGLEVVEGREALRRFFEEWTRAYDDYEQQLEEFRDLGGGVIFAVFLQRGRPKGSGGFLELRYAIVGSSADGLVERVVSYTDIDEARAAAERLAEERG